MPKQSYVHLEFGFWIEHVNLSSFGGRRLWVESLSEIRQLYASAENHRRTHGSAGEELLLRSAERRLRRRPASPPSASLNVVAYGFGQPSPLSMAPSPQWQVPRFAPPLASPSPQHHHHHHHYQQQQQQPPEPPLFVMPRRGNAAIRITAPVEAQQRRNEMIAQQC